MKHKTVNDLARDLARDFPELNFQPSSVARWSPSEKTVFYDATPANLLHELGHAISDHNDFIQDVELIKLERDAWEVARRLAPQYHLTISDDEIESALDDYREWLHSRSLCPRCNQTGVQSRETLDYHCINCDARWRANDARMCGLKRRTIK